MGHRLICFPFLRNYGQVANERPQSPVLTYFTQLSSERRGNQPV